MKIYERTIIEQRNKTEKTTVIKWKDYVSYKNKKIMKELKHIKPTLLMNKKSQVYFY